MCVSKISLYCDLYGFTNAGSYKNIDFTLPPSSCVLQFISGIILFCSEELTQAEGVKVRTAQSFYTATKLHIFHIVHVVCNPCKKKPVIYSMDGENILTLK